MFEAWEGIKARTYSVPQTCMELVELANSVRQQDPNIYSDTGRGPLSIKARTYSVPRTLHKQHAGWVFVASALKDFIIMGIQLGYYGAAEISFFLSSLFVHDTKKDLEISFPEQVLKKTTNQISDHFIGESFHLLTLFVHPLSRNPSKWSGKAYSLPVKVAQAQEPFICR